MNNRVKNLHMAGVEQLDRALLELNQQPVPAHALSGASHTIFNNTQPCQDAHHRSPSCDSFVDSWVNMFDHLLISEILIAEACPDNEEAAQLIAKAHSLYGKALQTLAEQGGIGDFASKIRETIDAAQKSIAKQPRFEPKGKKREAQAAPLSLPLRNHCFGSKSTSNRQREPGN